MDITQRKKAEEIDTGLKRIFEPDWIISSPLVRAAETARIVADGLASNVPVDQSLTLRPGGEPEDLVAGVRHEALVDGVLHLAGARALR